MRKTATPKTSVARALVLHTLVGSIWGSHRVTAPGAVVSALMVAQRPMVATQPKVLCEPKALCRPLGLCIILPRVALDSFEALHWHRKTRSLLQVKHTWGCWFGVLPRLAIPWKISP